MKIKSRHKDYYISYDVSIDANNYVRSEYWSRYGRETKIHIISWEICNKKTGALKTITPNSALYNTLEEQFKNECPKLQIQYRNFQNEPQVINSHSVSYEKTKVHTQKGCSQIKEISGKV